MLSTSAAKWLQHFPHSQKVATVAGLIPDAKLFVACHSRLSPSISCLLLHLSLSNKGQKNTHSEGVKVTIHHPETVLNPDELKATSKLLSVAIGHLGLDIIIGLHSYFFSMNQLVVDNWISFAVTHPSAVHIFCAVLWVATYLLSWFHSWWTLCANASLLASLRAISRYTNIWFVAL